jgi:rhodanese-related sulfurtransferase
MVAGSNLPNPNPEDAVLPARSRLVLVIAVLVLSAESARAEEFKGKVKSVAATASVLSVLVEGRGVVVVRWDKSTALVNAREAKEIKPDELVVVEPGADGAPARTITRVVARIPEGIRSLKTDEVASMLAMRDRRALLIDARPATRFAEGHIPGAISIPWPDLEKQGPALLPKDRSTPLVFYCGGVTCVLSPKAAALAKAAGFTDVAVYPEGEPGWKKSDRLLESTLDFARTANAVIVDLREPGLAAAGHLPHAVSIPAAKLAGLEKAFPAWKGVPIVVYGASPSALAQAAETLRDWDYTAATALGGGLEAWKAAGLPLETGPLPTAIHFERKLPANEVAVADFEKAVKDRSAVILDVRTPEEFARGHFPGAINLPADEVGLHAAELPRDRPIFVHCATGARAEMAHDAAREKGVAVKFLKAEVEFRAAGSWTIAG